MREKIYVSEEDIVNYESPAKELTINGDKFYAIDFEELISLNCIEYCTYYKRIKDQKIFQYCWSVFYHEDGEEEKGYDPNWVEINVRKKMVNDYFWDEE